MTREPHDPDLTPEQEQEVRRLLADARHAAPIPEDVAARLDRVLADLASGDHPAPVVSLASHRRRRAATMLVAAAAVVVAGVGLGQVLGTGGQGGSDSPAASGARADGDTDGNRAAESAPQDSTRSSSLAGGDGIVDSYDVPSPVRVREQHFSADVRHARHLLTASLRAAKDQSNDQATEGYADSAAAPCPEGDWGAGRLVAATYDGQQAVLVFRAVAGDTQVVDLFACGSDVALRSITLPAP